MRELEELIKKRISALEEELRSLNAETEQDTEELQTLKKKIEDLKKRKRTLSLTLEKAKGQLDILERFYYSIDKLEELEKTVESLTEDDLENIDRFDSFIDGKRDNWKVDVQLAKYYIKHKDSIKPEGLEVALQRVHDIFTEIISYRERLHEEIEKLEEGMKTASKTLREYNKRTRELEANNLKREQIVQERTKTISALREINPYEVTSLNAKYLENLRSLFGNDQDYLEFLKAIVKNNSALLKSNPKLDKLISSVKERLDSATTFEEKERLSELYMLLIYCKSGKDKDGVILGHLERKGYTLSEEDERVFLQLINIDAEASLRESFQKMKKYITFGTDITSHDPVLIRKYRTLTSSFESKKGETEIPDFAKYLVLESEESIDTLYEYVVLQNIARQLRISTLDEAGDSLAKSKDEYLKELSKVLREVLRNKYYSNRSETDINDYQEIEELFLSITTVNRTEMIDALAKKIPREKVINCEIYDEDGNIDLAKVKEILLVYKKKELAMLRSKVDKTSGLKRALDQLNEVIYDDISDEFIDDILLTNFRDQSKVSALLERHLYELFECRKKVIKSLEMDDIEEEVDLYLEVIMQTHGKYIDVFEKMKIEIFGIQSSNLEQLKPFLGRVMLNLVEEDLKNNTDSSDFLRELVQYFKDIVEIGYSDYKVFEYLPILIDNLKEIDLDEIHSKEGLMQAVIDKTPAELKEIMKEPEEKVEDRAGTLILFKTEDEEELFHPDVNLNEQGKLLESALSHLRRMSYDALTRPQGSVDKVKGEGEAVAGLFRYRSGDLRVCYKVIPPETMSILNGNNDFSYGAGIVVLYVIKKHDDNEIYENEVIPKAAEFARKMQGELMEELTAGSRESVNNTIRAHERIYKKYTGHGESGIGAKTHE